MLLKKSKTLSTYDFHGSDLASALHGIRIQCTAVVCLPLSARRRGKSAIPTAFYFQEKLLYSKQRWGVVLFCFPFQIFFLLTIFYFFTQNKVGRPPVPPPLDLPLNIENVVNSLSCHRQFPLLVWLELHVNAFDYI